MLIQSNVTKSLSRAILTEYGRNRNQPIQAAFKKKIRDWSGQRLRSVFGIKSISSTPEATWEF